MGPVSLRLLALTALAVVTLTCLVPGLPVSGAEPLDVNGNWSPWGKLQTFCVEKDNDTVRVACGGGVRKRYRSCTNPRPHGNGEDCKGNNTETVVCNTHPCQLPGHFLWSAWSECTTKCGRGTQRRHTMCGSIRYKAEEVKMEHKLDQSKRKKRSAVKDYKPEIADLFELEFGTPCTDNQKKNEEQVCNTWNPKECPNPCNKVTCPSFAVCENLSNDTDPGYECQCQLGTKMKDDGSACIEPPPTTPTPRPIPTLPAAQKTVSTAITRGASTIIIVFLGVTIIMFLAMGIFDPSRVIHMNMEIALICAHICLLPSVYEDDAELCRVLSILIHYFHTACFMFMFLEAVHMYSLVSWVVHKDGLLTRAQNTVVGWGLAFIIVLFNLCFLYDEYGGVYHCWLQMDTGLFYGQFLPIIVLLVLTLAIIEAAGSADSYEKLEDVDKSQRLTAKIMQRTLIFILILVFMSFFLGASAEYEQNMPLYSIFTLVNGVLGFFVFFFHCSANETVRNKLAKFGRKICPKKKT